MYVAYRIPKRTEHNTLICKTTIEAFEMALDRMREEWNPEHFHLNQVGEADNHFSVSFSFPEPVWVRDLSDGWEGDSVDQETTEEGSDVRKFS